MRIEFVLKSLKNSLEYTTLIEKKMSKLDKFFSSADTLAKVNLSTEGTSFTIEATIFYPGYSTPLRAEITSPDMRENINQIVPKIERQIEKFRTRQESKKSVSKPTFAIPAMLQEVSEEDIEHVKFGKVVRIKSFEIATESVDDAIAQMELLDHNFYVFVNTVDNKVSVLYKRHDGDYGLITPSY
ncbi:MAG: ribosome-associated translation inhibitor RaiA [Christensenellaceae bacterium]|jgi:putative sigma-54 modulation protein|nr:ribosome-associated translation inhibitor RaiA [Christensenellaceae bacterium]